MRYKEHIFDYFKACGFLMVGMLVLVIAFLLIYSSNSLKVFGAEQTAQPYTIEWPPAWSVKTLPGPTTANGMDLGGIRVRALKKEKNGVAAAIELTYFPRRDGGKATLEGELPTLLKTITNGYESKGLKVSTTPPKQSTLGSLPASEIEVKATGANFELCQWIAMAFGKNYVYSLTYTGRKPEFESLRHDFDSCLKSLVLQ